jgi:hypothetical protein
VPPHQLHHALTAIASPSLLQARQNPEQVSLPTSSSQVMLHSVKLRLSDLPVLGTEKGELPYSVWRVDAKAVIAAAQGEEILTTPFPAHMDGSVQAWYRRANSTVYAALLTSVRGQRLLADKVRRLEGTSSSSYEAWCTIQDHFIKKGRNNLSYLEGKLRALVPKDTENMESFLSRCEDLRVVYSSYGLTLADQQLITHVLSHLSLQWQRLNSVQAMDSCHWTWSMLSEALLLEDNERRQANWKAPDALLPLGWKKYKGDARAASGRSSSSPRTRGNARRATSSDESPSSSPPSTPKGTHSHTSTPSTSPSKEKSYASAARGGGSKTYTTKGPLVCYHCCKVGHVWVDRACPLYDSKWKPNEGHKTQAQALREKIKTDKTPPSSPHGQGKVASSHC